MDHSHTIGIDFGDHTCKVAVLDSGGSARIVADSLGRTAIPSVVTFPLIGSPMAGFDAVLFGVPESTVVHPVTLAGCTPAQLLAMNGRYPYTFARDEQGGMCIEANRMYPTVHEVLTLLFCHLKACAEQSLGGSVTRAVIAVPDGAAQQKRMAIKEAAQAAGLTVLQLVNQTVAAALGANLESGRARSALILDVGAGHVGISRLRVGGGILHVEATAFLSSGASERAWSIARMIADSYRRESGVDLLAAMDGAVNHEFRTEANYVLEELSTKEVVIASVGGIARDGTRIVVDIRREEFERAISNWLREIEVPLRQQNANADILLVGGGSQIPAVQRMVRRVCNKAPVSMIGVDPVHVVALGAAKKAAIVIGALATVVREVTVHDLGTWVLRGNSERVMDVLIPRGTVVPVEQYKDYRMNPYTGMYEELVYEFDGYQSGQGVSENDPRVIVLARAFVNLTPSDRQQVRCTFGIDSSNIPYFTVTDRGNGAVHQITGFTLQ